MTEFDKVIPPGGVGKVTASLDTSHYRGPVSKTITVRTVAPSPAAVVLLELKASITSPVDVTPTDAPVVRFTRGEPAATEITVAASDGKRFAILDVQADPAVAVTVRVPAGEPPKKARRTRKAVAADSKRYVVSIVPKADLPIGQTVASVSLTTDLPKAEHIPIRAVVMVVGAVRVVPDRLFVRPNQNGAILHARISKPSGEPLRILAVESTDPDFSATATPIQDGREYDLAVRYTGKPARGAVTAQITIKTSDPGQPAVAIPLAGSI